MACYNRPEEKKELQRLIDKAARWQRLTDKELEYIEMMEKELTTV